MPRNLLERCEVLFPVQDPQLRARLRNEILAAYLADTAKTRMLEPDGDYRRAHSHAAERASAKAPDRKSAEKGGFSAQDFFIQLAEGRTTLETIPAPVEMGPTQARPATRRKRPPPKRRAAQQVAG